MLHILGADITRFHAIYWPMFLESLGLRKPDREFVHGLLMMRDSKMSKSKGNVVDPFPLVERYGVDAVRYYLAREINFGSDGSFSPEQFVERINSDLANSLGNLLNRTVSMINKYFDGVIPEYKGKVTPFDGELESMANSVIKNYENLMDDLKITDAIVAVNELVNRANKYIDETTPWVLAKEGKTEELASVMFHLANSIYIAGMLMKPILVTASDPRTCADRPGFSVPCNKPRSLPAWAASHARQRAYLSWIRIRIRIRIRIQHARARQAALRRNSPQLAATRSRLPQTVFPPEAPGIWACSRGYAGGLSKSGTKSRASRPPRRGKRSLWPPNRGAPLLYPSLLPCPGEGTPCP